MCLVKLKTVLGTGHILIKIQRRIIRIESTFRYDESKLQTRIAVLNFGNIFSHGDGCPFYVNQNQYKHFKKMIKFIN